MQEKAINKHLFVWVFSFLLGGIAVDRFVRGQVWLGVLKIIVNAGTHGIWFFIDWIVAIVKAYNTYSDTEDITFINGRYSR